MILVYILTTLIISTWIIRSIIEKKIIFRSTTLDIPLLIFLGSQTISTILSIDQQTSFFGFYSRFNGGLLSTITYSLLYWSFVSNFDKDEVLKLIKVWLVSAVLVSIYGILEHFGVDKNVWVQDVQNRVFSTLGQPNWLAAWVVALIPIAFSQMLNVKKLNAKSLIYFFISILFFITLLFTKSRSGILGFVVADLIFWGFILMQNVKENWKPFAVYHLAFAFLALIIGTQFTPSLEQYFSRNKDLPTEASVQKGPALETGGTESGEIRKIVWQGALDVWLHYPIFGSGVETFAYSYSKYRPTEHNLVSEWDFVYNKAHNEFLNIAANSGAVGLLAYLILVSASIVVFFKTKNYALLAGFVSLLVSQFFGFSVVPTQLELFLFPAFAIAISGQQLAISKKGEKISSNQKIIIVLILMATCYLLIAISRYWYADTLYLRGKSNNSNKRPDIAVEYLKNAIDIEPYQSLYHNEIASSYTALSLISFNQKDATNAAQFADLAISESQKAIEISPSNPNLKRSRFGIFITLTSVSPKYLLSARDTLIYAIEFSPTDAKLYYNLGLVFARTDDLENAIKVLQKTIDLKSNYKEARLAYAFLLIEKGENAEAKIQLEYILKFIDPKDELTKQTLESIK